MSKHALLEDMMDLARERKSMIGLSRDAKVSREAMYRALNAASDPRLSTLVKLAGVMGYEIVLNKRHSPVNQAS